MAKILNYLNDDNGASAAEYALILAIVGAGIAVAAIFLGGTIGNVVSKAGNCVATHTAAAC